MNQATWKYLRDRLERAVRKHTESIKENPAPWVHDFRRRLRREEIRHYKIRQRIRGKINRAAELVRERMIHDDKIGTLAALKEFERKKFQ